MLNCGILNLKDADNHFIYRRFMDKWKRWGVLEFVITTLEGFLMIF